MIAPNIKWDQNWQSQIKAFSKELDEIKNKQVGTLLTEGDTLQTEQTKLTKEIRQLKDEQKSLSQVFLYHLQAKREVDRLNETTNKATHNPREKNFLGTGAGTKWNTNGWLKTAETHFTPSTGKLNNLYKVKISGTDYETTEEQIINLIARVVKALQKVDSTDFEAKYNAKETDSTKKAQVKAYLKEIQDQAAEIIVGSSKDNGGNTKQPSYDFSQNYHQGKFADNGTWQAESTDYSQPAFNYQHFFEFITLTHNQPFLNDLDTDKHKDVDKNEPWQIFLKGEKWEKDKLADYGIKIDSTKTELYKTSETDKRTITAGTGISGWLDLAHSVSQNSANQSKLTAAFTNSPTQQLLTDLNGWTQGTDGFLTDGTNFTLPESLEAMETILAELESKKISNATEQGLLAKQISEKNKSLKQKTDDLKAKETELDTLIKEIITKQRQKLTAYKISDGFADQHKRTYSELFQINTSLKNIRYLENDGDENVPSSILAENTAFDQTEQLLIRLVREFRSVRYFQELAYKKVSEDKTEYDIPQALLRIKAGKYTDLDGKEHEIYQAKEDFIADFEKKAKLVKLSDWEQSAWKALKEDKESVEEKLTDWQSKLKTLDPLLTEATITEEKMKDFQKHVNFKKIAGVEELLKKVFGSDNKVQADFITTLKKEDPEVDDLAKMITKFEAEKIIKLIHLYEYEKKTEKDQQELRRKFSWERGKKVSDKYVAEDGDYSLSETEKTDFQKFLYELATGAKTLTSISKPTEQNEDNGNNNPTITDEKGHFQKYWHWWAGGVGLVAVIGGLIFTYWDKIKNLWETPEGENSDDE
jgi:hypothetical protein